MSSVRLILYLNSKDRSVAKKKKKKKNNKNVLPRFLVLALLLIAIIGTVTAVAIITKKNSSSSYAQMAEASLPVVSLSYIDGQYSTDLYGYVNEMDNAGMRDIIVPLNDDKSLDISVLSCGRTITSVGYQLRSLDDASYLDGGTIDAAGNTGTFSTRLRFSDLVENGREYRLILEVTADDRPVYYYARVLYAKTMHADTLMAFAKEFSEATYDREKAATFIVNYIRPDDETTTSDYYYTTLTSKYTMFTYGNLNVERGDDVLMRITELSPTQISVTLEYDVRIEDNGSWKDYAVSEFFCARYRSEKVYLLDYYRTLERKFSVEMATSENGRIGLGIGSGDTQVMNSDDRVFTVFVEKRNIWSYNSKLNSMNLIFSFQDENDPTHRSEYDHHAVQVVRVENDGSVDYMVYGYMNRGSYEGQVGICFYRYNAKNNATERLFFMPVFQSEQMLMTDLGTLAYVNGEDVCYLRYGDGIYSIDLNSGETVEVSIRAYPGMYAMNERGNVVAWQEGDNLTYPERLVILNMDSQTTIVVDAEEGEYVKILDFIGDDIVYGFGRESDSVTLANIDTQQLLTRVLIASTDAKLEIQQEYRAHDFFILTAEVRDNRIAIKRGRKNSTGTLRPIEDDVLLLTQSLFADAEKSMLMSRTYGDLKNGYYIQIGTTSNTDSQFSTVVPRYESDREVNVIRLVHRQTDVYYVYGYGRLMHVESEINRAIDEAFEAFGVVVDAEMNYLWTRGTRDLIKTISIQPFTTENPQGTLAASLRILCAQEGLQLPNVEQDLAAGMSPYEIIDNALGERSSVNLYGCTLSEVLYFVNLGHPVLAITGDREAVIINGYDTTSVNVYFPDTGETETLLMDIASQYFERSGNSFVSYR